MNESVNKLEDVFPQIAELVRDIAIYIDTHRIEDVQAEILDRQAELLGYDVGSSRRQRLTLSTIHRKHREILDYIGIELTEVLDGRQIAMDQPLHETQAKETSQVY